MANSDKTPLNLTQSNALIESTLAPPRTTQNRVYLYILLGILLLYYAFFIPNGYGNHDDVYRMIGTWRSLLSEHIYVPSRFQGYLIPELVIGLSSQLGGFYLSNLVSTLLSIASLFLFYQLIVRIVPQTIALLAIAAVGSNPFWIIASTTSTDYVYPAFFFLLGLFLLFHEKIRLSGLVFALSVSARITYAPMAVIAFVFYFPYLGIKPSLRKYFWQGVVLFFISSATLYLPVFFASGMNLSFLKFATNTSGGTFGVIARFLYKNVYLWGLPAFIALSAFLLKNRNFYWQKLSSNPFSNTKVSKILFHAVFWWLLYNELWFARLPHQYQYLIPVLFCVAYLIAINPSIKQSVICLSLVTAFHLLHGFINFDVLQTYQTGTDNRTIHSDGAKVDFHIDDGVLIRDLKWRSTYQRNFTNDFNQRWQHYGSPLINPR